MSSRLTKKWFFFGKKIKIAWLAFNWTLFAPPPIIGHTRNVYVGTCLCIVEVLSCEQKNPFFLFLSSLFSAPVDMREEKEKGRERHVSVFSPSLLKTSRRPTCFLFFPCVPNEGPPPFPKAAFFFIFFFRGERGGGGIWGNLPSVSPLLSLCTILLEKRGEREYNLGSCPSSFQWGEGGRREEKGPLPNPTAFLFFSPQPNPTRKPVCCLHPTYGPTLAAQAAAAAAVGSAGVFTQKNAWKSQTKDFFKK